MNFFSGLLAGRSHIAFLAGLSLALLLIWRVAPPPSSGPTLEDYRERLGLHDPPALRETGQALSEGERAWAKSAWRYFENNYQATTGLVNSVDQYTSTTLWDLGSYLMGVLSARELGLISPAQAGERIEKLLESLARLPLVDGILPNKAYNTRSLQMVDYENHPTPVGLGWSAIDIARIGVPFTLIVWRYPEFTPHVRKVLRNWRLEQSVDHGMLQGSNRSKSGALQRVEEGRFGYEEYAAKALFLLGLDVSRAGRYDLDVQIATVSGQRILYDSRLPARYGGTHNAVLSEPHILDGLEFGFDRTTLALAQAVLLAQAGRYRETGILTAVSEDNIDRPPYFVYSSVLNDRKPWTAFSPDGKDASAHRGLSLKAAMGWGYLFGGDYGARLLGAVGDLQDPSRGFYSGRYEADGAKNRSLTANTNGIVLEILLYRLRGPLLRSARN